MKTRITALLLALVMAVCCLTGCTSTRVRSYSEESSDASTDKYAAALNAYKSNKKVMTVNGSTVYWNEYAYFLCAIMANMERYGMQITDWSAVYDESTGETYSDIMTKSVVNNIAWNHLIETKAAENGVTFDAAGDRPDHSERRGRRRHRGRAERKAPVVLHGSGPVQVLHQDAVSL